MFVSFAILRNVTSSELFPYRFWVKTSSCFSIPGGDDFLNMQPQPVRQLPYLLEDYYSPSPSPMLPPMNALTHSQSALLPQIFSQQQQQQHGQHSPRHKYLPYLHYGLFNFIFRLQFCASFQMRAQLISQCIWAPLRAAQAKVTYSAKLR